MHLPYRLGKGPKKLPAVPSSIPCLLLLTTFGLVIFELDYNAIWMKYNGYEGRILNKMCDELGIKTSLHCGTDVNNQSPLQT